MQVELFNRRRWKTRIELPSAIHDYIELWHNTRRRHSALGMLTPTEYETFTHPPTKPPTPEPDSTIPGVDPSPPRTAGGFK